MPTEISKPSPKFVKSSSNKLMSPLVLVLFASAVLLTGVMAMAFGHKFGYYRGYQASQKAYEEQNESQELTSEGIQQLKANVTSLTSQLEAAKKERDISLNNLGQLRSDIQELEVKNLQLLQVNDVYANSLIEQGGLPLQIVGAKMQPLPENAFEYRFDVAMLSKDGRQHRLTPTLTLLDEENLVEVPLEPSTYNIQGMARIRGRFVMPKGFSPKQAKLTLTANEEEVEQIYNWQLSSPVDAMPMSLSEIPETDQRPVTDGKSGDDKDK
ncbi:hypothetical protein [Psychrobacter sp. FDAARGOS_221]|uniref:hypothetical protein n=1 Tax=Psychrobacter sp. FDAARGOS_221 TaxID=1975705 RepID=UPI000BB54140|nr:hypothetical protein [Psychrobacter sp. FDAARGOS_221]PNK59957.1 hypothetical protein A6J60_003040 [Psychrobacter sp. FDAARGOS_221]